MCPNRYVFVTITVDGIFIFGAAYKSCPVFKLIKKFETHLNSKSYIAHKIDTIETEIEHDNYLIDCKVRGIIGLRSEIKRSKNVVRFLELLSPESD